MLFPLELIVVALLLVCGCWSRRVAVVFLTLVAVSLTIFAYRFGNPIGLLVSGGGWMILDAILAGAALIGNCFRSVTLIKQ